MTPLDRAIAAINNTARVANIAGDEGGVLSDTPFRVITNPEDVARAVIAAIREPSEAMKSQYYERACDGLEQVNDPAEVMAVMIDALLAERAGS